MTIRSVIAKLPLSGIVWCVLAFFFAAPQVFAQGGPGCPELRFGKDIAQPGAGRNPNAVSAANLAPGELSAYTAFYKVKPEESDKMIELGEAYLAKYPRGAYIEAVYSQLSVAEYQKKDFAKMDEYGDQALTLDPNDLTVLVFNGWVVPHWASPTQAQLAKAETYEKRVLDLMPTLVKPNGVKEKDFAAAKSQYAAQAHSGLGLVYYRKQEYEGAVAELRQGIAASPSPDPTDYFALGKSLDSLDRFSEAAAAFKSCASIPGSEQGPCRQQLDAEKKRASAKPAPSTVATSSNLNQH